MRNLTKLRPKVFRRDDSFCVFEIFFSILSVMSSARSMAHVESRFAELMSDFVDPVMFE